MPAIRLLLFVLFLFSCTISAQNKSDSFLNKTKDIAKITHYTKTDFNADPQFWTMAEDRNGILFFGNNDGALIFDGEHWQEIHLPNNSSIRSLYIDNNNTVYAGGYNELGTIKKDSEGKYYYNSLMADLKIDDKNLENVWQIQPLDGAVICRTFGELIVISGKSAAHIPANNRFIYSNAVRGNYYVEDANHGIMQLDLKKMQLSLLFRPEDYRNEEIASILPSEYPDVVTIISRSGNCYFGNVRTHQITPWATLFNDNLKDQVTSATTTQNGDYLVGTLSSKIILVGKNGIVIKNAPAFSNMQNLSVHSLYRTKDNNIWALLNNGLDFIDFHSPYSPIFNKASVYDALVHNGQIFLATNQGIYYTDPQEILSNNQPFEFKKVKNLHGQTWSIALRDGDVIAGHDDGLFRIENGTPYKIGTQNGFWKIIPIEGKPGFFLASNYNGLYLVEKKGTTWAMLQKISGFNESARDILKATEPNTYWVCHGYKGVYKIRINEEYTRVNAIEHFTDKNGLLSPFNVNVTRWNNQIVFTTNTGIYTYDNNLKKFISHQQLNAILDKSKNTRKLLQYGDKTWYVQDDEAGYFFTKEQKPVLHSELFANMKGSFNRGMECIIPLGENKVIFGTTTGLYLYNLKKDNAIHQPTTLITKASFTSDLESIYLPLDAKEKPELPNKTDILRFEFAAPKMGRGTTVQYSYMLENTDLNWSAWQKTSYKEYTHLRPGSYVFKVRSRNASGVMGSEARYAFTIVPKWYQTNVAYIAYAALSIGLILLLIQTIKRKIEREKLKSGLEAQKSKKLLELELEQLKLQRDKEEIHKDKLHLEEDILTKSKELANYTMLLVKKKDIFSELQYDLKELKDLLKSEDSRKKLMEIFQKLNQHKIGEEYMEVFDVNFEKVHHNFFEKLKEINPTLTKRELRLCAFVKMNLTNKEISPLLNISTRGVETARYRVRKKLNVQQEDNFISFLEQLSTM